MSSPIALPDPFGLTADPDGYVPRPATEEALAALLKTLREGRRPAALLGPPGLGKTLLLHLAGKRLDDWLRSVYLPYAALPLDELCAWALSLVGFSQSSDTIGDLLQTASELRSRGSGLLLLIDDAGAMPLPTARKLGDLIALSSGGLRMLAAAAEGPSASRMLAATGANVHLVRLLEPMNEEETREYVAARLAAHRGSFRADLGGLLPRKLTERGFPDLNCLLIRTIRRAAPTPLDVDPMSTTRVMIGAQVSTPWKSERTSRLGVSPQGFDRTSIPGRHPRTQLVLPMPEGAPGVRGRDRCTHLQAPA